MKVHVMLPVIHGNKDKFDAVGVEWLEPTKDRFLALAALPNDWFIRERPAHSWGRSFVILNSEKNPVLDVWIKTHPKRYAEVHSIFGAANRIIPFISESLQEEFNTLMNRYESAIKRESEMIDEAYSGLEKFVIAHPECEYDISMPEKVNLQKR